MIAVALVVGIFLFVERESFSARFVILVSSFDFLVLSLGIHGLIAHSLRPATKGSLITYPLLMWVLWAVLFLVFVFALLPLYCPDFLLGG